jgi:hypothetical protein
VKLATPDGKIAGRVDYLADLPEGTVIKDYKTGAIFEKNEDLPEPQEPELKSDYVVQLQLYAGVYYENTGRWPVSLQIIPLSGRAEAVPIVPEQCLALLQQARSKLDEINALLSTANAAALARPAKDTCKYCGFRPSCPPYRQASGLAAAEDWPPDVASDIMSASASTGGSLLRLMNGLNVLVPTSPNGHPQTLSPGSPIALYNLKRLRSGALYAWRGTRVFIESPPPAPHQQTATTPAGQP